MNIELPLEHITNGLEHITKGTVGHAAMLDDASYQRYWNHLREKSNVHNFVDMNSSTTPQVVQNQKLIEVL
jgi:hypothetical protein